MQIKKKHMVIAIILVIILVSGGVFVGLNWNYWFSPAALTMSDDKKTPDIDPNAEDYHDQLPNEEQGGTTSGIAIPGYKSITLKAGTKSQEVALINPAQNNCYFVITLSLSDGTKLFTSKMIPPGKGIYHVDLTQTLKAGTYEKCTIKYDTFKMDDTLTPLNGADVALSLIVNEK